MWLRVLDRDFFARYAEVWAWRCFPQDPVYLLPGCVVRYLEFERIWVKRNRASGEQTPISDHCRVYTIL